EWTPRGTSTVPSSAGRCSKNTSRSRYRAIAHATIQLGCDTRQQTARSELLRSRNSGQTYTKRKLHSLAKEGWLRHQRKFGKSHRSRRSRGGFPFGFIGKPPRPCDKRMLRDIF